MITQNKHTKSWGITCDRCSTEFIEIEVDSFIGAVEELKELGWNVFKNEDDEWTHTCLECGLL